MTMRTQPAASPTRSSRASADQWLAVRRVLRVLVLYAVLLTMCLFVMMPIGWMLTAALKPNTAPVFTFPPEWYPTTHWRWRTFVEALTNPAMPFYRYTLNSLFICAMNILGAVASCSMIAYPFARLRFRGKTVLFNAVIATMLLPGPVLLIPQFLLFYRIGWYGTYLPLIVPAFTGIPFYIFLLRQYMRTIPLDLDEAARIDGAGYWTTYWRIIIPLTFPALTVVAVFTFLGSWNDFFGPLIYLTDQDDFTVALALATFVRRVGVRWNVMMAANLVAILPVLVLYFFAQNKLIGGIASVGIKG